MLKPFLSFLGKQELKKIILFVIVLGIFIRALLVENSFGPFAIDDYNHNVIPAYAMALGIPEQIPNYRSPLFVWILSKVFDLGMMIGIQEKVSLLKFMHFSLGVFFLFSNLGLYLYLKSKTADHSLISLTLVIYNFHFLLVYISTKAFGEFFSIVFFMAGLGMIEIFHKKNKFLFLLGIFVLGFSSFFRYQNGILYISYLVYWFLFRGKDKVLYFISMGLLLVGLQALIDILFGRYPLSTLLNYLVVNQNVSEVYGRTGYHTYVVLFLGLSLFPLSLLFLRSKEKLLILTKEHEVILFLFFVFLFIHSLIPHQEERFMAPIIPLFLILLSHLLYLYQDDVWVNKIYFPFFGILHGVLLFIVITNNNQVGSFVPIAKISDQFPSARIYYKDATFVRNLYLTHFFAFQKDIEFIEIKNSNQTLSELVKISPKTHVVFLTNNEELKNEWNLEKANIPYDCSDWIKETSLVDEVLFRLNPKINFKRAPSFYFYCEKKLH
ncbi:MAG: hypothetical protein NZ853_04310 [Leptospiraceae bacterium]|nr:hypothetical protein [Leptospiraceae bacterium]MDW7975397.1 hypothetical protein [Leptospiraceae bacterium]